MILFMFEDRTFDLIMSEMVEEFSSDVRVDDGSLLKNACSCIATKLEEFYTDLDLLNDNITPNTMDEQHLIDFGMERGVVFNYATPLVIQGTFPNEVSIDDIFTCGDFEFVVSDVVDAESFVYTLECNDVGTVPNVISSGTLTPVEYIDGVDSGYISSVVSLGRNDDDIEVYRQRVIDSFKQNPVAGNKDYYSLNINNIDGVGGCKPVRRQANSNLINIYIINDSFGVPSSDLVDSVQELVDPSSNHGEGLGIAPLCHNVNIVGASACNIDVVLDIDYEDNFGWVMLEDSIVNAINSYFTELRSEWESNGSNSITVRWTKIVSLLVSIEGIADISSITLDDGSSSPSTSNITVDYTDIPVLNSVTESGGA